MGATTRISDYEWERGDGPKEVPEGVDADAAAKSARPSDAVSTVTKSKVVEGEQKPAPKKTAAKTK